MKKRREWRVSDDAIAYLGPVAIAQFVDAGWIKHWPMAWTEGGIKAIDKGYGYGFWDGSKQNLPYPAIEKEGGVAYWPGRKTAKRSYDDAQGQADHER